MHLKNNKQILKNKLNLNKNLTNMDENRKPELCFDTKDAVAGFLETEDDGFKDEPENRPENEPEKSGCFQNGNNQDDIKKHPYEYLKITEIQDSERDFIKKRIFFKRRLMERFYDLLFLLDTDELRLSVDEVANQDLRCECYANMVLADSQYAYGVTTNKINDELLVMTHSERFSYDTRETETTDDTLSFYQFASRYEHNVEVLVSLYGLLVAKNVGKFPIGYGTLE